MTALRLAAAGWFGGDPAKVMQAPADWVVRAVQYVRMVEDYEEVYREMNREG